VDKHFQRHIGHLTVYLTDFIDRQFTRQNHTLEALMLQPFHFRRRTVIGLRRGVKRYRWKVHLQDSHILHQDSIYSSLLQFANQLLGCSQLIVKDYRIDSHIDTSLKLVGILTKLTNVVDTIANSSTGSESGSPNIDGIGTMVNGSNTTLQILGWSQQFKTGHAYPI
jgi:hypothetical protein